MQNATEVKATGPASQCCSPAASGGAVNRRTLYIGLGVAGAAGLFLGWDWLVAVGAASIIIAIAPCLIMCGLGLCMNRACRDKKTEVPAKTDTGNADAPVTTTTAADAPATNAAPPQLVAATVVPETGGESIAADEVAIAKAPLENATNGPASEARA